MTYDSAFDPSPKYFKANVKQERLCVCLYLVFAPGDSAPFIFVFV